MMVYRNVRGTAFPQSLIAAACIWQLAVSSANAQERSPDEVFSDRIEQAEFSYRVAIAEQIRKATTVEVVLLRFDDVQEGDMVGCEVEGRFPITPYQATTSVIATKVVDRSEAKDLLLALAELIEKPGPHFEQYLCHYPVHGVRIYSDTPHSQEGLGSGRRAIFWFIGDFRESSCGLTFFKRKYGFLFSDSATSGKREQRRGTRT